MEGSNKVCNLIIPGCKLVKDENDKASNVIIFKLIIRSLMYLLTTNPDMTFSVCLVVRYMERPTEMHVPAIKRIMRYLSSALNFDILYKHECTTNM